MKQEIVKINRQTETVRRIREELQLQQTLQGLKDSLKVFEEANDRESIYQTRRHIRTVESQLRIKR